MTMGFNLEGMVDVTRNIQRYTERYTKLLNKALLENGFHLLNKSIDMTPIEEGLLRGSGVVVSNEQIYAESDENGSIDIQSAHIRNNGQNHNLIQVTVGFNQFYAMKVHEWDDPEPNWSDPNTGPKYLSKPLEENMRLYNRNLAKAIEKALTDS